MGHYIDQIRVMCLIILTFISVCSKGMQLAIGITNRTIMLVYTALMEMNLRLINITLGTRQLQAS